MGRWARAVTALAIAGAPLVAYAQDPQGTTILHARIEAEVITPVIANFLADGVRRAEAEGHDAFLVELDTPGGLDTSMREIVQAFLGATTPVIVYVPSGARAASAGAIIAMSAETLAMAPGTAIGAATPVDLQGGDISSKIINDAAAFAVSVAEARDRDTGFARAAVVEGTSLTASEALEEGVADLIAADTDALLAELDLDDRARVAHELSVLQRVRQRLADPNLAFIFLSLGTLALIYEFANPGLGAGGIAGVILIVLALFSLSVLPVNTAGAAFIVLAIALFIGEVFVPGVGVLAAGGVASLVLGGLFLFKGSVGVSVALIIPVAATVGVLVAVAGRLAWRARMAPTETGVGQLVGKRGTVATRNGRAQVFLEGAWWNVRGTFDDGDVVVVTQMEGLDLIVEPGEEGT